jgi:hypothetical protein
VSGGEDEHHGDGRQVRQVIVFLNHLQLGDDGGDEGEGLARTGLRGNQEVVVVGVAGEDF